MTSILVPESSSEATSHVSKNESSAYDRFHRIDELAAIFSIEFLNEKEPGAAATRLSHKQAWGP